MKKLAYYLLPVVLLTLFLSSCSDDDKAAQPAATLSAVKATSHSLEFTITPQYAEKCVWMCYKKGETAPSAEEILSQGVPASNSETTTQRAIALEPETRYIILAAAISQGRQLLSEPLEMKTAFAMNGETPVVKLHVLDEAIYFMPKTETDKGNYTLRIGTAEPMDNKMPASVGDIIVQLDLYHQPDAHPENATLPSGEYRMATNGIEDATWNASHTAVFSRYSTSDNGIEYAQMHEGTIQVQRKGDTYTIDMDVTLEDGETFRGFFKGDIIFEKYEKPEVSDGYLPFEEDQDITFDSGQMRYIGSWFMPHADLMYLEFFNGKFKDNQLVDGYYLYLTSYMHKLADYNNPKLEEGTYNVFGRNVGESPLHQLPMTINHGTWEAPMGSYMAQGSYLMHINERTGKQRIALLQSGTLTVKANGDNYDFTFDFVARFIDDTAEPIKIKGSYNQQFLIENKNNNDSPDSGMPEKPMSNLEKDRKLEFAPQMTQVTAYAMGDYLYPNLNSWQINFDGGDYLADYITIEFFTDPKDGIASLPTGTYTVEQKFAPYYALPGFYPKTADTGGMEYAWYADMKTKDASGIAEVAAPLASGTMTVSQEGSDYKFVFDFTDDAGHKVSGEWKGTVLVNDLTK